MRRLTPRLFAYASRMLGDAGEAEDVAQEAMLRLWRAAPGWVSGQAKVSTWAYKVTGNLCIDRLRKRRPAELGEADEPLDDRPGVEAQMLEAARQRALKEAIAELPERQAMALTLRHLEGWSNPEIAEALEVGVEAVESLTARAKRRLADLLNARKEELGYGDG
jgi:RNA polymerase sigma-70 factor (ECF subfamily)